MDDNQKKGLVLLFGTVAVDPTNPQFAEAAAQDRNDLDSQLIGKNHITCLGNFAQAVVNQPPYRVHVGSLYPSAKQFLNIFGSYPGVHQYCAAWQVIN